MRRHSRGCTTATTSQSLLGHGGQLGTPPGQKASSAKDRGSASGAIASEGVNRGGPPWALSSVRVAQRALRLPTSTSCRAAWTFRPRTGTPRSRPPGRTRSEDGTDAIGQGQQGADTPRTRDTGLGPSFASMRSPSRRTGLRVRERRWRRCHQWRRLDPRLTSCGSKGEKDDHEASFEHALGNSTTIDAITPTERPRQPGTTDEGVGKSSIMGQLRAFPIDLASSPLPSGLYCSADSVVATVVYALSCGSSLKPERAVSSSRQTFTCYGFDLQRDMTCDAVRAVLPFITEAIGHRCWTWRTKRSRGKSHSRCLTSYRLPRYDSV